MASLVPITVPQGNDVTEPLSVFQADGVTPQDCTGLTPAMIIKASQNNDDSRSSKLAIGTGLTWVTQTKGLLTAFLPHTLTATAGGLWWRLDLTDGSGDVTTAMYGPLTVIPV